MPATRKKSPAKRARTQSTPRKRVITPDDLLRLVFVGDPRMSPDGESILFLRKHIDENRYHTNLWVVSSSGNDDPVQFTSGGQDRLGRWSRDGSRIAFVRSNRDTGQSQVFTMSAHGGEATALTDYPEGSIRAISWSPDGRFIAAAYRKTDPSRTKQAKKEREGSNTSTPPLVIEDTWYRLDGDGYFGADRYVLDLIDAETGETRTVFAKDSLGMFSFDISPDSTTIAVAANTKRDALLKPWNDDIYLITVATGKSKRLQSLPRGPKANVQWSPDGKSIAYAGREGIDSTYSTENLQLCICNPSRGSVKVLTGETDYCLMAVTLSDTAEAEFGPSFTWHPDGNDILARLGWHGEGHIASISAADGKVKLLTKGAQEYTLGSVSDDGKVLALLHGTATTLPEVTVGRLSSRGLRTDEVTGFNEALLAEVEVAKPTSHWVTSEDGTRVQVWVMRPPKPARGKTPAILQIHGGPHGQYGVPFFHEFQVLAAAGYAVFYSNPRGSKGYGRDFCHAIRGSWGGADWVDLQAVIGHMTKQDWVDAKRMGVMGGSYGGYMTNWIIGHTNMFAGAITDRCVSNLISMWGNSDFPFSPDKYWAGNSWDRIEDIWKSSPIRLLGNARTPTLIIHSVNDLRCNIEQAEQVFTVLKTHNVPTRFVRYPDSSHGLSRMGPPDLRLHRLNEILEWWKRWLA